MPKKNHEAFYPAALTVAGSDSGGGAGIQADLRTFNAFGVFGCSAVTALTSQNPREVRRVDTLPPESVRTQIETVLDAVAVRWAKTGMLAGAGVVETVAEIAAVRRLPLVCDPVMVSTSGVPLLEPAAVDVMRRRLLPAARWITPNLPEAELLLGVKITSFDGCVHAAKSLFELCGAAVLLKTGHAGFTADAADVVCREGRMYLLSSPRVEAPPYAPHGTGCTLSAALAAALAAGAHWKTALCEAKAFVFGSLSECAEVGPGLFAMYPPVNGYESSVTLKPLEGATSG